jgi:Glycosyltransferases involved in cell wall biogenesis
VGYDQPRVSIGLPVYNGEKYVAASLESILGQSYEDFELIISDNASTDRTREICLGYAAGDKRIRYHQAEWNMGAAWSFNHVFALARASYFKWVSHDDIHAKDFLSKCLPVLEQEQDAVLCYTGIVDIDENGAVIRPKQSGIKANEPRPSSRFRNLIRNDYSCEAMFGLIRSESLRGTKLIGNYSDSDRILLAELGLRGRFHEIDEPLFLHREHSERSVRKLRGRHARMVWFDRANENRLVFPFWRQFAEYLRVIGRSQLEPLERLLCYRAMAGWLVTNRKKLRNDLRRAARQVLGRLSHSPRGG